MGHCKRCGHRQLFKRQPIHHGVHFLLTVLTCGLWGISWLAVILGRGHRPFHCDQCGQRLYK